MTAAKSLMRCASTHARMRSGAETGAHTAAGRGYTYHGASHHLAYPGLPWLFAGTFKIFGADSLLPAHLILLLCGLATLALTYRLFYLHAGRPTAVLMTVALGISRTFYRYNFELLSDVPFLMGVMAFLAGYEAVFFRRYDRDVREGLPSARGKPRPYDWALLVGGLLVAMVMRPTMWALNDRSSWINRSNPSSPSSDTGPILATSWNCAPSCTVPAVTAT